MHIPSHLVDMETAVFGGGCFWCTEAVFKMLKGVSSVEPGYAGGRVENPTYEEVSGGRTGHVEVVQVVFDPALVSYRTLLTIFFASHDPTTIDRQGNDVGPQYRSAIFYSTPVQRAEAESFIQELNDSSADGEPIATSVEPLEKFYPAEDYHRDYYARNTSAGYCQVIINPKLEKVKEKFAEFLQEQYAH
ncbi:MAG: peptide methionine sulfoxide reductase MsrA [Candidatus Parcubacteria bacterium]